MKFPFSAPDTKIQRARKHLAELEEEVAAFVASGLIRFTTKTAELRGAKTIEINAVVVGAPASLGAIVGDVVHNLRAALDLTACEMVRAAGQSDKDVYFPFSESASELDTMIQRRRFDRAGAEAVELLRSLKPHHNGNAALRLIHDLDIHDKHRALIPHLTGIASPIIDVYGIDGTINPRIIGDPRAASEVKLLFPDDIEPRGRELIPTLHELVQLVEGVVKAFRALANRDA